MMAVSRIGDRIKFSVCQECPGVVELAKDPGAPQPKDMVEELQDRAVYSARASRLTR